MNSLGRFNDGKFVLLLAVSLAAVGLLVFDLLESMGFSVGLGSSSVYQLLAGITAWSLEVMSAYSGLAIFVLMVMESSSLPVPSEVVLPFAGFMAQTGKLSFEYGLLLSTAGAMIGSYVDYYIGRILGSSEWLQRNKLFHRGLVSANKWFDKYGAITVFACRFIVGVRTLISIPAGASGMSKWKFGVYTLLGCVIWNVSLMYAGYYLAERWDEAGSIFNRTIIPIAAVILLIAVGAYFIKQRYQKENLKEDSAQ
ncbi:MAG: DedA family protein [Thaumarchaeota archaeon]|nr:DedA family protein [Nitrososphaerota archaeon]MCL5317767.1 DedA family protein [Nitrososphaerota archaeon]